MPTAEAIVRSTLAELNANADVLLGLHWLTERFEELTERSRFPSLRRVGHLAIPAAIRAGTATFTNGSDVVTGDSTAQAAWAAQQTALVGRYIKAKTIWYEITAVAGSGSAPDLRLAVPFSETTASAAAYNLVVRTVALDGAVRFFGQFKAERYRDPLRLRNAQQLDRLAPSRDCLYTGPKIVVEAGEDAKGRRLLEFWPYSTLVEPIAYTYWPTPTPFAGRDPIPSCVSVDTLKEGLKINILTFKMHQALTAGEMERAAILRNEMRAQTTRWRDVKQEALAAARSTDDLTILASMGTSHAYGPADGDILNARAEWLATGGFQLLDQ